MSQIKHFLSVKEKDLGGLFVRRVLPQITQRTVGPFVFFDHMGPTPLAPGQSLDVRPHPHIGLSTVTYLFEGKGRHQDSLGHDQVILPGDINWMTAGKGIVHSERSPKEVREKGGPEHGIQCWVALPKEFEKTDPSFTHYAAGTLPEFEVGQAKVKLLIGSAFDLKSPVKTFSDLFYLEVKLPKNAPFRFPSNGQETAAYIVKGSVQIESHATPAFTMAIVEKDQDLILTAIEDSHLMILGGRSVGERFMDWNFVASSKELLEEAKKDWALGPKPGGRFSPIPGDDQEFIPLPGI